MKRQLLAILLSAFALGLFTPTAHAGAIRAAGKGIAKGSSVVAKTAASGGEAVADGVGTAGKTTGGAVSTAVTAVGHGAKTVGEKVWKVIW